MNKMDTTWQPVCASCGEPIVYNEVDGHWQHRDTKPRHPAKYQHPYQTEEWTMNELTTQDIDLLMRALDALSAEPYHRALMSGLMKSMTNKEADGKTIAEEVAGVAEKEVQVIKDDIVLVKAKLIAQRREQERALLFTGTRHEHL